MLPNIPHVNDTPHSSAPSTPNDERPPLSGHRRTDSVTIATGENEDYFMSIARFATPETKSAPVTPSIPRNISFSPRIQFHDTWPSGEYDRRGEIATCNRLTPMLAQQIKEELNTFKMVSGFLLHIGGQTLTLHRRWKFTSHPKSTRTSSNEHALLESMAIVLYCKPLTISWRSHST